MPTVCYTNAFFEINGVDLSPHVESLTLNYGAEVLDQTAMGDSARSRKGGLIDWSIDAEAHQDFASGAWDATLFSIVGTTACVEIRPQNICSTAVNPRYSGIVMLENYQPMGGTVGDLLNSPVSFQSTSGLDRDTSAT